MGDRCRIDLLFQLVGPAVGRIEYFLQIEINKRTQYLEAAINLFAEDSLGCIQPGGHMNVLCATAGKEECRRSGLARRQAGEDALRVRVFQRRDCFRAIATNNYATVFEGSSADLKCVSNI